MGIDFQGLLAVHSAAEAEPNFDMSSWRDTKAICGTTNCMIGSFCDRHRNDLLKLDLDPNDSGYLFPVFLDLSWENAISVRFRISQREAMWLFMARPDEANSDWNWSEATGLSKPAALARLRKFIYYKLHKQEMIVENNDRNRSIELPRNVSGRRSVVMAQSA